MRAMAAVLAFVEGGDEINVSAVCAQAGSSRKTFYKYVSRVRTEGLEGFEERSRRPYSSPAATAADIEEEVVRLRKELSDGGHDHGVMLKTFSPIATSPPSANSNA